MLAKKKKTKTKPNKTVIKLTPTAVLVSHYTQKKDTNHLLSGKASGGARTAMKPPQPSALDGEKVLPVPATPNNCSGMHPASWRNESGKEGKHLYSLSYIAVTGATPQTETLHSGTVPYAARRDTTCHTYLREAVVLI